MLNIHVLSLTVCVCVWFCAQQDSNHFYLVRGCIQKLKGSYYMHCACVHTVQILKLACVVLFSMHMASVLLLCSILTSSDCKCYSFTSQQAFGTL